MTIRTPIDVQHARIKINRVLFDAHNQEHRKAAREYLLTKKWSTLQFQLEGHYTSVPDMIKDRLLEFYFQQEQ